MIGGGMRISAILALCSLPAASQPVHLLFHWSSGKPAGEDAQVIIYAVQMAGDQRNAVPVRAISGPDGTTLNLDEGVWLVQGSVAGYWSQGAEVTVNGQESSIGQLTFWPAATLRGEIVTTQGGPLPRMLYVKLTAHRTDAASISSATQQLTPENAVLACPIQAVQPGDTDMWSCLAPSGFYDARLEVDGYAPYYTWGVKLTAAKSTDLGENELLRALSVSGRAIQKDGSAPPDSCRATLQPDAVRGQPDSEPDNPPANEKTFTVSLNQQGFFQFIGVMPGRHELTVMCPAGSGMALLDVQPKGETRIESPVVLEDLPLDITITPETDPTGQAWQLTLDATAPHLLRIVDEATVPADGRWKRRGFMTGSYRVIITGSDGAEWLRKDFDLRPDSGALALHLAWVRVAGRVLLNDQPVRARLMFSNQNGGEPVTINSDDGGRFAGLLPIAAGAQDSTWNIEAHVEHPKTTRRLVGVDVPPVANGSKAWLDLELPPMPIRGTVVSEDSRPQSGAQVTFQSLTSGYQTTVAADEMGSFELADLPPGQYRVAAKSSFGSSDPVSLAVVDGLESHLKLILHPNLHIPLYVVDKNQEPIEDATVQVWLPPGVPLTLGHTDRNGRYEATLPPGTTEVGLTVGADDYAITLSKMPVSSTPVANETDPVAHSNTVTLDTNGGSMILNLEPAEGTLDRSATLYLVHNGSLVDARTLDGWGSSHAGMNSDGPVNVDDIEPGDYALCIVNQPSQLMSLWDGSTPADSCNKGTVKPGQTLTMTPP